MISASDSDSGSSTIVPPLDQILLCIAHSKDVIQDRGGESSQLDTGKNKQQWCDDA